MIEVLIAVVIGLIVGVGLNPVATYLPKIGRNPDEVYPDEAPGEGIAVRLPARRYVLPLLNAALYGGLWWRAGDNLVVALVLIVYSTVFLLVAVVDLETRLIPNILILPAIGLALVGSLFDPRLTWQSALVGGVVGFLFFYVIALVARGGFGAGDVKLSAFIGTVAGFPAVLIGLAAGILVGGVAAILLLITRRATRKTFIPYGPFLCIGGWYAMLWGDQLFWGQFG